MPKYYEFKIAGYYLYFTSYCVIECMHVHASDRRLTEASQFTERRVHLQWVGTAAFSSKKETPKLFRLEVYPFIPFSREWSMFYAPRSFAMGRFCFA